MEDAKSQIEELLQQSDGQVGGEPPANATPQVTNEPAMDSGAPLPSGNELPPVENKNNNKTIIILLVLLIAILLAIGGVLLATNWNNWFGTSNTVTNETEVVAENTDLKGGTVTVEVDGKSITYSGAYIVDGTEATISSGEYASATDNQAVFVVANGGTLTIDGDVKISKTGSADFDGRGDNYSFYGLNSAIVVVGEGSSLTVKGATIETDTPGANAVIAVDSAHAVVGQTTITTTKDGSRGLHATYGGGIDAYETSISTAGGSSAALATDRGSGAIKAEAMELKTAGAGSPLVYSTGEIVVSGSTGTATGSQIAVVEGKNMIEFANCEFSANGNGNRNGVDNAGVMIYQSMSGDADEGMGIFNVTDSVLTVLDSSSVYTATPFFFVTNTTAKIVAINSVINYSPEQSLITAIGTNEWGQSGANGGIVQYSLTNTETTNTNVVVDSISSASIVE